MATVLPEVQLNTQISPSSAQFQTPQMPDVANGYDFTGHLEKNHDMLVAFREKQLTDRKVADDALTTERTNKFNEEANKLLDDLAKSEGEDCDAKYKDYEQRLESLRVSFREGLSDEQAKLYDKKSSAHASNNRVNAYDTWSKNMYNYNIKCTSAELDNNFNQIVGMYGTNKQDEARQKLIELNTASLTKRGFNSQDMIDQVTREYDDKLVKSWIGNLLDHENVRGAYDVLRNHKDMMSAIVYQELDGKVYKVSQELARQAQSQRLAVANNSLNTLKFAIDQCKEIAKVAPQSAYDTIVNLSNKLIPQIAKTKPVQAELLGISSKLVVANSAREMSQKTLDTLTSIPNIDPKIVDEVRGDTEYWGSLSRNSAYVEAQTKKSIDNQSNAITTNARTNFAVALKGKQWESALQYAGVIEDNSVDPSVLTNKLYTKEVLKLANDDLLDTLKSSRSTMLLSAEKDTYKIIKQIDNLISKLQIGVTVTGDDGKQYVVNPYAVDTFNKEKQYNEKQHDKQVKKLDSAMQLAKNAGNGNLLVFLAGEKDNLTKDEPQGALNLNKEVANKNVSDWKQKAIKEQVKDLKETQKLADDIGEHRLARQLGKQIDLITKGTSVAGANGLNEKKSIYATNKDNLEQFNNENKKLIEQFNRAITSGDSEGILNLGKELSERNDDDTFFKKGQSEVNKINKNALKEKTAYEKEKLDLMIKAGMPKEIVAQQSKLVDTLKGFDGLNYYANMHEIAKEEYDIAQKLYNKNPTKENETYLKNAEANYNQYRSNDFTSILERNRVDGLIANEQQRELNEEFNNYFKAGDYKKAVEKNNELYDFMKSQGYDRQAESLRALNNQSMAQKQIEDGIAEQKKLISLGGADNFDKAEKIQRDLQILRSYMTGEQAVQVDNAQYYIEQKVNKDGGMTPIGKARAVTAIKKDIITNGSLFSAVAEKFAKDKGVNVSQLSQDDLNHVKEITEDRATNIANSLIDEQEQQIKERYSTVARRNAELAYSIKNQVAVKVNQDQSKAGYDWHNLIDDNTKNIYNNLDDDSKKEVDNLVSRQLNKGTTDKQALTAVTSMIKSGQIQSISELQYQCSKYDIRDDEFLNVQGQWVEKKSAEINSLLKGSKTQTLDWLATHFIDGANDYKTLDFNEKEKVNLLYSKYCINAVQTALNEGTDINDVVALNDVLFRTRNNLEFNKQANSLKNNAEVEKAIDEDRKDIEEKIGAKVCQDYIGKLIDLGVDVSDFSQQAQLIKNGQAMMLRAVDENGKRISFFADGDTVQVANNLFDQLETMRKDAMDTMSKRLARSSDYFIAKKYMYGYRDTIDNFKTMAKEYAYIEKTDGNAPRINDNLVSLYNKYDISVPMLSLYTEILKDKIDKNNTNKSKLRTQFYNVEGLLKSSVDNGYTDIAKVFGE